MVARLLKRAHLQIPLHQLAFTPRIKFKGQTRSSLVRLVVAGILARPLRSQRRLEALADGLYHLGEPEKVEKGERNVGGEVACRQPCRKVAHCHERCGLMCGIAQGSGGRQLPDFVLSIPRRGITDRGSAPHISGHAIGSISPPNQAAEEERQGQDSTVDSLVDGAGETDFVTEPVDVEKRGG